MPVVANETELPACSGAFIGIVMLVIPPLTDFIFSGITILYGCQQVSPLNVAVYAESVKDVSGVSAEKIMKRYAQSCEFG